MRELGLFPFFPWFLSSFCFYRDAVEHANGLARCRAPAVIWEAESVTDGFVAWLLSGRWGPPVEERGPLLRQPRVAVGRVCTSESESESEAFLVTPLEWSIVEGACLLSSS